MRILRINSLSSEKKDWIDRDEVLLRASFQILEDYIEKEGGDTHCNYEAHKDFVDEIRFLNDWWKVRKNKKFSVSEEDAQDIEDNAMLVRLIKVRHMLWT